MLLLCQGLAHAPRLVFELGELGFVFANCTLVLYSFCTASMSLWYLKCLLQIIGHFLLLCDLRNLKIQEPHFLIRPQPSISQSNPFLFPSNRGGFSSNLCSQASFCLNKLQIILPNTAHLVRVQANASEDIVAIISGPFIHPKLSAWSVSLRSWLPAGKGIMRHLYSTERRQKSKLKTPKNTFQINKDKTS